MSYYTTSAEVFETDAMAKEYYLDKGERFLEMLTPDQRAIVKAL